MCIKFSTNFRESTRGFNFSPPIEHSKNSQVSDFVLRLSQSIWRTNIESIRNTLLFPSVWRMTTFLRMQLTVIGERRRRRGKFEILWNYFILSEKSCCFVLSPPHATLDEPCEHFLCERERENAALLRPYGFSAARRFLFLIFGGCARAVWGMTTNRQEKRESARERKRGTPGNGKFKLNKKREKWKCGSDEISLCLSFCDENVNWQATGSW